MDEATFNDLVTRARAGRQPTEALALTQITIPKVWSNATCARYTLKENGTNKHTVWLSGLTFYPPTITIIIPTLTLHQL